MLKSDSTGSLKFRRNKLNKLPALNLKPNFLNERTSYENIFSTNKKNKMNFIENKNFNRTTIYENNLSKNEENLENIKAQKEKILIEIKGLEKRRLDAIDIVTKLELKKASLNEEINEMNLSLKQLENKKLYLIREVEDTRKYLEESKEEEKNLNQKLTEMKNNYDIYLHNIQDMDNCIGKNIERNINEINIRKEVLSHKENYLNKIYIKNQNELKDKEELINSQKILNIKKQLELEDIKKNLILEKKEFNLKSLELKKGFNNLNEQTKEKEIYFNSLEEQLNEANEKLEQEKKEIKNEKKEIKKTKKIIDISLKDYYEKIEILKQKEKEINKERKQLKREKQAFHDEVNKIRINNTLDNIFNKNNKIMTEQERISDVTFLGSFLKESITKEKKLNPNNFIDPKKDIKKNVTILPLYLLSNWLEKNGCQVAIEIKPKDIRLNKFCLQQIFSNKAIEKKFTLVFNEKYNEYFLNKDNTNNLINSLKNDISNYLQIPSKEIFIMNPRGPPFTIDLYIKDLTDFQRMRIEQYIKSKRKDIIIIKDSILLEGCKLSPAILEPQFDMRPCDWPRNICYRANIEYHPPFGYLGFGLKILDTYDNGDNTWIGQCNQEGEFAVAYHGIRSNIGAIKQILNSYLKAGENQAYENVEDYLHPGHICGKGVYVTPFIEVAEKYTKEFYAEELNKSFRIVFQCRVNPNKIRQPITKPEYWILEGNGQEIRPYRLLIKQENN